MKSAPKILEVMSQLEIRKWDGDPSFIYNSWLRSFVGNSTMVRGVPTQWVYKFHAAVIGEILKHADIIVMSLRDDPDVIIGYAVAEKSGPRAIIHYVYVKKSYHGMGIACTLIEYIRSHFHSDSSLSMIASHTTELGRERLMKQHELLYNPYLIFMGDLQRGNDEIEKPGTVASGARRSQTPRGKILQVGQV